MLFYLQLNFLVAVACVAYLSRLFVLYLINIHGQLWGEQNNGLLTQAYSGLCLLSSQNLRTQSCTGVGGVSWEVEDKLTTDEKRQQTSVRQPPRGSWDKLEVELCFAVFFSFFFLSLSLLDTELIYSFIQSGNMKGSGRRILPSALYYLQSFTR